MKMKFSIQALLVAGALVSLASCKKNEDMPPQKNKIKSVSREVSINGVSLSPRGYLVFANEDVYNDALGSLSSMSTDEIKLWESSLSYVSFYDLASEAAEKEMTIASSNNTVEDDLFRTIINKDGLIQIGDYIFKAECDKDYVTEINARDVDRYFDKFADGNVVEGVTNRFDLGEEDAFEKLNAGLRGYTTAAKLPMFGTGDKYNDEIEVSDGKTWRAKCKAEYQKAVFYYSLMTELKHEWKSNTGVFWHQWNTDIYLDVCSYSWKNKKGSTGSNNSYYSHTYDNKLNFRPYAGSRGLKSGTSFLKADFKYLTVPYSYIRTVPYHLQINI